MKKIRIMILGLGITALSGQLVAMDGGYAYETSQGVSVDGMNYHNGFKIKNLCYADFTVIPRSQDPHSDFQKAIKILENSFNPLAMDEGDINFTGNTTINNWQVNFDPNDADEQQSADDNAQDKDALQDTNNSRTPQDNSLDDSQENAKSHMSDNNNEHAGAAGKADNKKTKSDSAVSAWFANHPAKAAVLVATLCIGAIGIPVIIFKLIKKQHKKKSKNTRMHEPTDDENYKS